MTGKVLHGIDSQLFESTHVSVMSRALIGELPAEYDVLANCNRGGGICRASDVFPPHCFTGKCHHHRCTVLFCSFFSPRGDKRVFRAVRPSKEMPLGFCKYIVGFVKRKSPYDCVCVIFMD